MSLPCSLLPNSSVLNNSILLIPGCCLDIGKYIHIDFGHGWRFAAFLKVVYWRKHWERFQDSELCGPFTLEYHRYHWPGKAMWAGLMSCWLMRSSVHDPCHLRREFTWGFCMLCDSFESKSVL